MKKLLLISTLFTASAFTVANTAPDAAQAAPAQVQKFGGDMHHGKQDKHDKQGKKGRERMAGGFLDNTIVTVASLKDAKDDQFVTLEGNIVQQTGKKTYLFKDATGETVVEISRKAWRGQEISPTDKVKIRAEIDKEWGKTEIDVKHVEKQ